MERVGERAVRRGFEVDMEIAKKKTESAREQCSNPLGSTKATHVKVHCWPRAFQGKSSDVKSQAGSSGRAPHYQHRVPGSAITSGDTET